MRNEERPDRVDRASAWISIISGLLAILAFFGIADAVDLWNTGVSLGSLVHAPAPDPLANHDADQGVPDEPYVEAARVEVSVFEDAVEKFGGGPYLAICPDLPAVVGASVRCTLNLDGLIYGVSVTTTTVESDGVSFHIEVDENPQ